MDNAIRTSGTDMRASAGVLIGLLLGVLAGIGAVVLFAPQSGKETREQIKQKSIELQDRAASTFGDLVILSRFDNRKILAGTRKNTGNEWSYQERCYEP